MPLMLFDMQNARESGNDFIVTQLADLLYVVDIIKAGRLAS